MSARIAECVNCGVKPTIQKQSGRYPYRLDHPKPSTCPGEFHIESHQKTRALCISDWNRHQAKFFRVTE